MTLHPFRTALLAAAVLGIAAAQTAAPSPATPSPYAPQIQSPVRGLSAQEVDDLLNGRGAGYARSAELNSYPGPAHTLELRVELALTADQVAKISAVQTRMKSSAVPLGKRIVDLEAALSRAFATNSLDVQTLQTRSIELGELYGRYRAVHLAAHLEITPLLTNDQIRRYNMLRGYASHDHPR